MYWISLRKWNVSFGRLFVKTRMFLQDSQGNYLGWSPWIKITLRRGIVNSMGGPLFSTHEGGFSVNEGGNIFNMTIKNIADRLYFYMCVGHYKVGFFRVSFNIWKYKLVPFTWNRKGWEGRK